MTERNRKKTRTTSTRTVNAGSTIRMQAPKTKGRKPKTSQIVVQNQVVGGFVNFLREHAIVGLAVGFVIGTQVQTVVKQLVSSFLVPAFTLLFGNNLTRETYTWHFRGRSAEFGWGAFAYGLLDFFFVLAAIYFIIKIFSLDKLDKPTTSK